MQMRSNSRRNHQCFSCFRTLLRIFGTTSRETNGETMKRLLGVGAALILVFAGTMRSGAQDASTTQSARPMVLTDAIPLEGVKGRFDHFATSGKALFVSALGNNTVEVIDIGGRSLERTLAGVPNPQGVVFSPETNKLFVGSDEGKLYIYDGASFDLLTTLDFRGDVDNLRYDSGTKRVYVGYGEDEAGAIGTVDATTGQRTAEEYKLGAHPESFQLETTGPNIYVNLPDLKQIAVIDRGTHAIARWPLTPEHNFPMALDEANHRLFVGMHEPACLAVFDMRSGHMIACVPSVQDADDLYYDAARKRIYMPGGEGFIYVFQQTDPDHYRLLARIPTALGARTAGYFGRGKKGFDRFYLAVPARADRGAEIWIYTVQN
jgi:DNA-binding beta-propeller fold protein YncE